jgi:membrane-associated protein
MTLREFVDLFLHLDKHLASFIGDHGLWIYALLFLIIFCETGLVVTPFLPGDSLLFAVGALAAQGLMDIAVLLPLLFVAAVLGDTANYALGAWVGPKVFDRPGGWFFRRDHLAKAHVFYEKYGGRAIIFARFMPIVRTFVPFVAGIGSMRYRPFLAYNVSGAAFWVGLILGGGYFFGNLPGVRDNMKLVILGIIVVSFLPLVWEWVRARSAKPSPS